MIPGSHRIKFEPTGISLPGGQDETLSEVAKRGGVPVRHDCGGKGLCGKCMIIAEPPESLSPLSEAELSEAKEDRNVEAICINTMLHSCLAG